MTPLFARIVRENRVVLLPLAIALAANLLIYIILVRPLGVKSAGAEDRARSAAAALRSAERDLADARTLVSGKARADEELSAFYQKVLPADLSAARRMTYATLPALAKKTSVRYEARTMDIQAVEKDARLGRMTIRMVLQGGYENLRQFIYELESAPNFIIIDDVTLVEGQGGEALTINLSTYFRLRANGV